MPTVMPSSSPSRRCMDLRPERPVPGIVEDAAAGLLEAPRSLPPKYFYDAVGSALFDRICDTPEYYPTRTEAALLAAHAGDIMRRCQPRALVELGSGTSRKTRHLLRAAPAPARLTYWPLDVCEPVLEAQAIALEQEFPGLAVQPLVGDYHGGLAHLPPMPGPRLFVFLGGTLGNFRHHEALALLQELAVLMAPADALLLGVDRVKSTARLNAAYNDAAGVTAAFNLNLLQVLNRELAADFDPAAFSHHAAYDERAAQIEMALISRRAQQVELGALQRCITLAEGEPIRTEISRKFTPESLRALLAEAGLGLEALYQPEDGSFSLVSARRG
ncbi:MAG TPA: L-histidine N(alpha)-methyltransferase [Gammaproteobacteria bacterium]|nr:L-histidine N(alpha)-methyltransferase [Gammaproteobacteria bacterium]